MTAPTMTDEPQYRLVQRRGSTVAHTLPLRTRTTLCGQWVPGHRSWPVQPSELPLCKRCAKRLEGETR